MRLEVLMKRNLDARVRNDYVRDFLVPEMDQALILSSIKEFLLRILII